MIGAPVSLRFDVIDAGSGTRTRDSGTTALIAGSVGAFSWASIPSFAGAVSDEQFKLHGSVLNGAATAGAGTGLVGNAVSVSFGNNNAGTKPTATNIRDYRLYSNTSLCAEGSVFPALFDDDVNTVSHVVFRNGAFVDLKARNWTVNGAHTVNQTFPPSDGNWSDTIYYSIAAGTINPTVAPFIACFAVRESGVGINNPYILDMRSGTSGAAFAMQGGGPTGVQILTSVGTTTANAIQRGEDGVWCAGYDGTNNLVKLNTGATVSAVATFTPNAAVVPSLGRFNGGGQAFGNGRIYEMWLSLGTMPTDALFTTKINTAIARMNAAQF